MLNDTVTSLIRTWVPLAVGWVITALAVDVDSEALTAGLVSIVTAVYYLVARVAEQRWAPAGWLLGSPKAPSY